MSAHHTTSFDALAELATTALDLVPEPYAEQVADAVMVSAAHAIATLQRGGVTADSVKDLVKDAANAAAGFLPESVSIDGRDVPLDTIVSVVLTALELAVDAIVEEAKPKAAEVTAPMLRLRVRRHDVADVFPPRGA